MLAPYEEPIEEFRLALKVRANDSAKITAALEAWVSAFAEWFRRPLGIRPVSGLHETPQDDALREVLGTLKSLRGWFFTLTFLAIGLTTRFRELTAVGIKPFLAFAVGVAINVPVGYFLSVHVFADFWNAL